MLFWAPGAWDSLVKGKCRCILREMLPRCLPMKLDGLEAFHGRLQDGCWLWRDIPPSGRYVIWCKILQILTRLFLCATACGIVTGEKARQWFYNSGYQSP